MEINVVDIPTSNIREFDVNPRKHTDEQIKKIQDSISEFGFRTPIVIDENSKVLSGHARFEAAKRMGMTSVPCVVVGHLSETQKKAFLLSDNKIADMSYFDESILKEEIESIMYSQDFELDILGFSDADLSNIFADEDPETEEFVCPDCGHKWEECV